MSVCQAASLVEVTTVTGACCRRTVAYHDAFDRLGAIMPPGEARPEPTVTTIIGPRSNLMQLVKQRLCRVRVSDRTNMPAAAGP